MVHLIIVSIYIRTTREENARMLADNPFFK